MHKLLGHEVVWFWNWAIVETEFVQGSGYLRQSLASEISKCSSCRSCAFITQALENQNTSNREENECHESSERVPTEIGRAHV